MFYLRILCVAAFLGVCPGHEVLQTIYEWKYIDYLWKNNAQRQNAINSGAYDLEQQVTIDVDMWRDKHFVTVIRNPAVPATLSTVSNRIGPGGPLLNPYPNWEYNNNGCDGFTSVYRVAIDRCDRLWALDTGVNGEHMVCPAQLHVFNLRTDKLIKRIPIPPEVSQNPTTNLSLLATPVVHVNPFDCNKFTVYMADVEGEGLVIFDGEKFWRHNSPTYVHDPQVTTYTILGESFTLDDGILGLALTKDWKFPELWYRPMSSRDMYRVSLRELDRTQSTENIKVNSYKNLLPSQAAAMAFSKDGVLFFVESTETSLACLNRNNPVDRKYLVSLVKDPVRLQFGSGVKVIDTRDCEYVYTSTNRLQKIYDGTMNYNDTNFRIMRGDVRQLIANTKCQSRHMFGGF